MRILHIDTDTIWRSRENQLWLFLDYLKDNEQVTNYLVAKKNSAISERSDNIVMTFDLDLNWEYSPTSIVYLSNICKTYGIDIIIAYTPKAHGVAIMVKKMNPKLKVILHCRSSETISNSFLNRIKYNSSKIDKYIVTSSNVSDSLIRLGVPSKKINIIKNACSGSEFIFRSKKDTKYVLSRKFEFPFDLPLIGNISHFSYTNKTELLFKSLGKLAQENVGFFCLVAGEGPKRKELEDLCRELRIHHFVRFIGFMEDVSQLLHAIDILTVISNKEELSTITLDAIYSDCCVVGACKNTESDYLINGETGFLSNINDTDLFTANLRKVLNDSSLRANLCKSAKSLTLKEHSLDSMVISILGVCKELLNNPKV